MIKFEHAALKRSKSHQVTTAAKKLPIFSPRKTCQPQKNAFFIEEKAGKS
jgi:hypothetical protein